MQFYENDAILVETVRDFLIATVRAGDSAVVVATAPHRDAFETALTAAGIDVEAAVSEDRYLAFDAADTLSRFMVDGTPDPARFFTTIDAVMDRASRGGRRIRVYGEMVALLWEARDVASALALEGLWNAFAKSRAFELLCAYPAPTFDQDTAAEFERICAQHTEVIPGGPSRPPVVTRPASPAPIPQTRDLTVDEIRVWRSFMTAHARLSRRLEADMVAAHALSLASYDVLLQLLAAPDRQLRMTELADRVVISRSGLTRLVDRLCEHGLVRRKTCENDARGYFAILTPEGHERLRSAADTHRRGVQEYTTGRFSTEEMRAFSGLLAVLTPGANPLPVALTLAPFV